jgi:cellulose biosynthesis protein BcsQ
MEQAKEVEDFKDEPLPILGIAVSMYDQKSTSFNLSMAEEIREILAKNSESHKISLFPENTWIPRLNIVSHCPDKGYPIHQTEFDDNLSQQEREAAQKAITRYENLAAQLISLT